MGAPSEPRTEVQCSLKVFGLNLQPNDEGKQDKDEFVKSGLATFSHQQQGGLASQAL